MSDVPAVVITHPERGLYLGGFLGDGLWSAVNKDEWEGIGVPLFADTDVAHEYMAAWDQEPNPARYRLVEVLADNAVYATEPEIRAAGLGPLLDGDALSAPKPQKPRSRRGFVAPF